MAEVRIAAERMAEVMGRKCILGGGSERVEKE